MGNRLLTVMICSSLLFVTACQTKSPQAPEKRTQPEQQSSAAPAPTAATNAPTTSVAQPEMKPAKDATTPPDQSGKHAAQNKPQTAGTPALPQQPSDKPQAEAPVRPIVLTGAPMGGVKFEHPKHPLACDSCHHASREPKPNSAPQQACTSCHTKPAQPGMKTGKQAAFHNATATAGTCIDCHKKSGGAAPTKCTQCHKRENA